jgi:hypothetical protein|tara:strand:+ start:445 stop:648 length:204 start_codon:yes stop_codon:yes gene_type:complete
MIDLFRLLQIKEEMQRFEERKEAFDVLNRLKAETLSNRLKTTLRKEQNDRFDKRSKEQDKLRNHDLD